MALVTEFGLHEDKLRADLQQYYCIDLDHAMGGEHTPHHIACLAVQLPQGARVLAAENSDTVWGLSETMLATLVNDFRMFVWGMGDKRKRGNPPERIGPSTMTKPIGKSLPARKLPVDELLRELNKPRRNNAKRSR